MNLDEYQEKAVATAIYPANYSVIYPAMGAVNEAGEVAGKVKKIMRGDAVSYSAVADEIGDTLWYLAALARDLGFKLSDIAKGNLSKLASRAERGVLQGNGDNR